MKIHSIRTPELVEGRATQDERKNTINLRFISLIIASFTLAAPHAHGMAENPASDKSTSVALPFAQYVEKKLEALSAKTLDVTESITAKISNEKQEIQRLHDEARVKKIHLSFSQVETKQKELSEIISQEYERMWSYHDELIALKEAITLVESPLREILKKQGKQLMNVLDKVEIRVPKKRNRNDQPEIEELQDRIAQEKYRQLSQPGEREKKIKEKALVGGTVEQRPEAKVTFNPIVKVIKVEKYIPEGTMSEFRELKAINKAQKKLKLTTQEDDDDNQGDGDNAKGTE